LFCDNFWVVEVIAFLWGIGGWLGWDTLWMLESVCRFIEFGKIFGLGLSKVCELLDFNEFLVELLTQCHATQLNIDAMTSNPS